MANLSPAQIQERRDAARARWAKAREAGAAVAGGAVAGVLGGFATGGAVNELRDRAVAGRRAYALPPLRAAIAENVSRDTFINRRAAKAKAAIRSDKTFLPAAIRAYSIKERLGSRLASALAAHEDRHSEPFFDSTTGETVHASTDAAGEARLRDKVAVANAEERGRFKATADDLRAKGKNPLKVERKGGIVAPKVASFSQRYRGKPTLAMPGVARSALAQIFAYDADSKNDDKSALHDLGIRSEADLERHMGALSPGDRAVFTTFLRHEIGLNGVKLRRPRATKDVRNAFRVVPDHTTTIPGYPRPAQRNQMKAELLRDIDGRQRAKLAEQAEHAAAQIGDARARIKDVVGALRWLRPGSIARRGIVGAGIGASVLAGAFAAARAERALDHKFTGPQVHKIDGDSIFPHLRKSENQNDNAPQPRKKRSTADHLLDVADNVEQKLAAGVGRALAGWKAAVTPETVMTPDSQGSLFDQLDEPLAAGMSSLDIATRAGVAAPGQLLPPGDETNDDGTPRKRLISFGFGVRNKAVEQYAKTYRYSRVRDITDAQRKNIRQIIVDATQTGAPPAVIAKKVKDVVGLTASQAAAVQNYRALLETADPRALSYELRDKRFDASVEAAAAAKQPMDQEKIDKLVDIYQRRFIAHRAMTIARTEALRAANNGHVKTVEDWLANNPDFTVAKTWIATEDDRTRPDHRGLHRQTVIGMQTPFVCESGEKIRWPHDPKGAAKEVINCFHPDTIIQGNVQLATRARYSGPMREITTRSGAKLTVTLNHPIATPKGFSAAVGLRDGDQLIRYIGNTDALSVPSFGNDKKNKPSTIKEIFDTLWQKGSSSSVKIGSHDFHGDGKFGHGDVEIVFSNWKLMLTLDGSGAQSAQQIRFSGANSGVSALKSNGATCFDIIAVDTHSRGSMSRSNLPQDALRIGLDVLPLQSLSFGPASYLDFSLPKPAGNDIPVEAGLIRNLLERYPAEVTLDEIVEVRDFYYSGHVYDVQTTSKCVFAQDLLASNCRCTLLTALIPRSAAAKHGPSAYEQPTQNYWDGPHPAYHVDDPDEIFGSPDLEPA